MSLKNNPLAVELCGIEFRNPVSTAAGTFGYGWQFNGFYDVGSSLGSITTKGVSANPWQGNPHPRLAELPSSIMNSVGLENPGVEQFALKAGDELSSYVQKGCKVIVQAVGHSTVEFEEAITRIEELCPWASALEINVSCPNLERGGRLIGGTPHDAAAIVRAARPLTKRPLFVKLAPYDVAEIARACEAEGADGLSLINTISGMALDVHTRTSRLSRPTGGVSGPAIHAIALRMVWEAAQAVSIPINGMGGVSSWQDAAEMILAGASLVSVGTANLYNPMAAVEIVEGLSAWVEEQGVGSIKELIGAAEC